MKKANTEPQASNTNPSDQSSGRAWDPFNFQHPIRMHSSFDGYGFSMGNMTGVSVTAVWDDDAGTADPSGTIWLEASNSRATNSDNIDVDSWAKIADSEKTISLRGIYIWNLRDAYYSWIRAKYERTSGDGNIFLRFNAKGF